MNQKVDNLCIKRFKSLITPEKLKADFTISQNLQSDIYSFRKDIKNIILGKDKRLLIIVGPCSIHDPKAAIEYAEKLAKLRKKYIDKLYIIMRVYFEKPRTTIGWKGFINDPHLDDSYDIEEGFTQARKLLKEILECRLPTATEFLDPILPQYISDLICWVAIGARTTESQTHREMASGLSMPVGFKNNTNGNIQVGIDAMISSQAPHHFLGIDSSGKVNLVETLGNPNSHIILRGGTERPNYDPQTVHMAAVLLSSTKLNTNIMVDCSHANSNKQFEKQEVVWENIIQQRKEGNTYLMGLMLESNLYEGNQKLTGNLSDLKYGVSITDACISFEKTEKLFEKAYNYLN